MNAIAVLFRRAQTLLKQAAHGVIPFAERMARTAIAYRIHARIAELQGRKAAHSQYQEIAGMYAHQARVRGFSSPLFAI